MKQREIKFRTWNKRLILMDYNPDYNSCSEKINNSFGWSKEIIELQYTGFKDKNNKEIYEGDIVEINNKLLEIIYSDCIAGFGTQRDGFYFQYRLNNKGAFMGNKNYSIKIVGNIYENPELLKRGLDKLS